MKILIIKRDKIGDMLLMTPMLAHLREQRPDVEIHVLANDYNAWVLEGNPNVDRIWVYPRVRHGAELRPAALWKQVLQVWKLRRQHFDVAIAGGGVISPRAIRRTLLAGAKRSIAYCNPNENEKLSDPLSLPPRLHEVEANLHLLTPLGIVMPEKAIYPTFQLPPRWDAFARQWITENGLNQQGYIVLGINARRAKRKPTFEQIVRWSSHFKSTWNLDTVLIWQPGHWDNRVYPGDDEHIGPLLDTLPNHVHPFRHEESLLPALGVVWHAATSVFPDGGMAHLASISPGGVLALFAETDVSPHPDNWRPYTLQSDYIEGKKSVADLEDQQIFGKIQALLARNIVPSPISNRGGRFSL